MLLFRIIIHPQKIFFKCYLAKYFVHLHFFHKKTGTVRESFLP